MTKQEAVEYVRSCGENDGPEIYEEAAELFTALYGRSPDDEDGDQCDVWSLCCAAVAAESWAVLDIRGESGRYGRIVSRHASQAEADPAMVDHARAQLGGSVLTADALPRLMWTIAEVSGKVGQRVRYEAVRR